MPTNDCRQPVQATQAMAGFHAPTRRAGRRHSLRTGHPSGIDLAHPLWREDIEAQRTRCGDGEELLLPPPFIIDVVTRTPQCRHNLIEDSDSRAVGGVLRCPLDKRR